MWVIKQHLGKLGATPAREVGKDGFLESGESVGVREVLCELVQTLAPHIVGSQGSAGEDMSCGFRATTSGALVIILVLPSQESGAHATIGRSMLGDPAAAARLQGSHFHGTSVPVNLIGSGFSDAFVSHPPHLCGLISK